jgi:hypothetical protein
MWNEEIAVEERGLYTSLNPVRGPSRSEKGGWEILTGVDVNRVGTTQPSVHPGIECGCTSALGYWLNGEW